MISNYVLLAIPTVISCIFLQLTQIVNAIYAGKMDDPIKLAGVGLGITWLNVVSFSICQGINGA